MAICSPLLLLSFAKGIILAGVANLSIPKDRAPSEIRYRRRRRGECQKEGATVKRTLRIAALPMATALIALSAALFLGAANNGAAAPNSLLAGKWCAGQQIVFFPGGPAGGVFAVNVYTGAKQAAADLGANVQYVWSNWDPETMVKQFKAAIATRPAGLAVMGHPGPAALKAWG